jgi:hypothetical protein
MYYCGKPDCQREKKRQAKKGGAIFKAEAPEEPVETPQEPAAPLAMAREVDDAVAGGQSPFEPDQAAE